ncbi:MAG: hypothetical protein KGL39_13785 [Patescibacteria group bacterium]|nr:hypothetical protein [Patescibacteria group bacterium]
MTHALRAKRYRRLADYIAKQPKEYFSQKDLLCGIAASIAMHCAIMLRRVDVDWEWGSWGTERGVHPSLVCIKYLGLQSEKGFMLLSPRAPWQTRDQAVRELRRRAKLEDAKAA